MSKISNIITMLELLNTGRKYNIKELSEILEVSERMVRIYKEELEKAGIYIDTIMGPYGGYVLNRKINLPLRRFSTKDSEILNSYIQNEKNSSKREDLILLQDKIKGFSINSKEENNSNDNCYNILTKAMKEKLKVKITYYSFKIGEEERIIYPSQMFLFDNGWYCAAFCELRNDIRHFELKRIHKCELLDEKFI